MTRLHFFTIHSLSLQKLIEHNYMAGAVINTNIIIYIGNIGK